MAEEERFGPPARHSRMRVVTFVAPTGQRHRVGGVDEDTLYEQIDMLARHYASQGRPAAINAPIPQPKATLGGAVDLATGAAGAAVSEIAGGLAGAGFAPFKGAEIAAQTMEDVRDTTQRFLPEIEAEGVETLQALGGAIPDFIKEPVKAGFQWVTDTTDDIANRAADDFEPVTKGGLIGEIAFANLESTLQFFGALEPGQTFRGPAIGAGIQAFPTAIVEMFGGAGGFKGVSRRLEELDIGQARKVANNLAKAAPSQDDLKGLAQVMYKQLDGSGIEIRPDAYEQLALDIMDAAKQSGIGRTLTPKAMDALDIVQSHIGDSLTMQEFLILRRQIRKAAEAPDAQDAQSGIKMLEEFDAFMDSLSDAQVFNPRGVIVPQQVDTLRTANRLWRQYSKADIIELAFVRARNQASGFENGLRAQMRSLAGNPKQRKRFSKEELEIMDMIVQGEFKGNLARLIGKLGFAEGGSTNLIGGAIGAGLGSRVGGALAGPGGAVAGSVMVPTIGQISKGLARRLTFGEAEFLDAVIRAGSNGQKIVEAYIKHTPPRKRALESDLRNKNRKNWSSTELAQLLLRDDIILPPGNADPIIDRAITLARLTRDMAGVGAGIGAAAMQNRLSMLPTEDEESE